MQTVRYITVRGKRALDQILDRRTQILDAAARAFFEHGYAATSIDTIIEDVRGSKRSIYKEFGSKEGLFTALVSTIADSALSTLSEEKFEGDLEGTLRKFGRKLAHIYLSPSLIGVYRVVVAEGRRFPSLARAFYDKGPQRAVERLAEVLFEASRPGGPSRTACTKSADIFVGMLRGNLHLQAVLALRQDLSEAEIGRAVDSAVDIFLAGALRKAA
jgi:AcrR family transcriptional regulator